MPFDLESEEYKRNLIVLSALQGSSTAGSYTFDLGASTESDESEPEEHPEPDPFLDDWRRQAELVAKRFPTHSLALLQTIDTAIIKASQFVDVPLLRDAVESTLVTGLVEQLSHSLSYGGSGLGSGLFEEAALQFHQLLNPRASTIEELRAAFEQSPVESGMAHPAERVLEEAVRRYGADEVGEEIARSWSSLDAEEQAGTLRCCGRIHAIEDAIRAVVAESLTSDDLLVRDAAVRALEGWHSKASLELLREHRTREPDAVLASYVERVLQGE